MKRDFTDVRDIVKGYWELVQKGKSGEIYNIGSGKSYSIKELLYKMIELSGKNIEVAVDPDKFRPADIPELRADIRKIKRHIGWQPKIDILTSLVGHYGLLEEGMLKELVKIYEYREMLRNMVKKELRARYKGSLLGFFLDFPKSSFDADSVFNSIFNCYENSNSGI